MRFREAWPLEHPIWNVIRSEFFREGPLPGSYRCRGRRASGAQHAQRLTDAEDLHQALQVVREHVKAHFSPYTWQSLCQEVRIAHSHLECAERVLHCRAT
jgi:hypothetical protein